MFKINDVVISPNDMPAIIVEVYDNGMSYFVNEMPKPSLEELEDMKKHSSESELESLEFTYKHDELKIPNDKQKDSLDFLIKAGYTFPTVN